MNRSRINIGLLCHNSMKFDPAYKSLFNNNKVKSVYKDPNTCSWMTVKELIIW